MIDKDLTGAVPVGGGVPALTGDVPGPIARKVNSL